MELTEKQQAARDEHAAGLSDYARYYAQENAKSDAMNADRNRRYLRLRLSGLSIDDAYETLLAQLSAECGSKMVQISGMDAYDDEYQCGDALEEVIAMRAPELSQGY